MRILRLLEQRGLEADWDLFALDDPLLATFAAGAEAGRQRQRFDDRVEAVEGGSDWEDMIFVGCVRLRGMSLHADVYVPAGDRHTLCQPN